MIEIEDDFPAVHLGPRQAGDGVRLHVATQHVVGDLVARGDVHFQRRQSAVVT